MIFSLFWLILISFFFVQIMSNLSLMTVNKCAIMIIIMSKVSWKEIFMGFQLKVVENKHTFMKKSCSANNHSDVLQS